MQKQLAKILIVTAAAILVSACVSDEATWYEQRCQNIGFVKGTTDFNDCIERDKAWIEADRKRSESNRLR
jgi:hypothetical protein